MNDGYKTDDLAFSAALAYLFGQESITQIDATQFHAVVTIDCPSEDAKLYRDQFDRHELAISSLKAYVKVLDDLRARCRRTRTSEFQVWQSPAWIAGRGA
ncbi:MAG: hypothetical protein ACM3WP_02135 [Acidobacteriota bacterium]